MDGERHPHRTAGHRHGADPPPTRRRATVSGAMVAEARDGKLVRGWFYWDQLALLSQLGITEQPGLLLSVEGF